MTAYTPRFRGVADGDDGAAAGRPSRRLLRLPVSDDTDPGPAPGGTPVNGDRGRVLHLPDDRDDAPTLRVLPGLPARLPVVGVDDVDLDDRPLRSARRRDPAPGRSAASPALPPPAPPVSSVLPPRVPPPAPSAPVSSTTTSPLPAAPPHQVPPHQVSPAQVPPAPAQPHDSTPPDPPTPADLPSRRSRHGGPATEAAAASGPVTGPMLFERVEEHRPPTSRPRARDRSWRNPEPVEEPGPSRPLPGPVSPPRAGTDILPGRAGTRASGPAPAALPPAASPARPRASAVPAQPPAPAVPAVGARVASDPDPRPARGGARHRAGAPEVVTRRRTRQLVLGLSAGVVALGVLLWAADGGLAALSSPALAVESVGRLAGTIGAALLALLVVLAAGVPAVEAAFGRARLLRWHVTVGATSFALVVGHAFLAVAASALVEDDSVLEAAWRLLADFPATSLAAVGLALLVVVVVTSRRAARASRGRDAWHLLHLYGYLGVFLALPHLVVTAALPAALYWLALYLMAAGVVVAWRGYAPLARSLRHQLVVAEVAPESESTVTVVLRGRRLAELGAEPGVTLRLRFLDGRRWFVVHPAAVLSTSGGSRLRLSVPRSADDGRPGDVAKGTWVLVDGPSRVFTTASRTRPRLAVVAAGTSVAPVCALLEESPYEPGDVVVVHRVREADRAPFRDELAGLAERRGVEVISLEGPRSPDRRSWLPADAAERIGDADAITHLVADVADRDVLVSGPPEWLALVVKALRAAGVPTDRIHADSFVG